MADPNPPVIGLLLAGLAGPSQGVAVRTVTASRRTTAAAIAIGVGFLVLLFGPTLALSLLEHLSLDTVDLIAGVLSMLAMTVLADKR